MLNIFVCKCCINPVTGTGRTSVDIGLNANLELCYLGDMLSVIGDADELWRTKFE